MLPPGQGLENFAPALRLDPGVLGFTAAIVVLTGVLFGLAPALGASRQDASAVLKEESSTAAGSRRRTRMRSALIVMQVASCVLLLVAAGLLVRSLQRASTLDLGFDPSDLYVTSFRLRPYGYTPETAQRFITQLTERVRALPGVRGATVSTVVPLGFGRESLGYRIEGYTRPDGRQYTSVDTNLVGGRYFETLGIPIVRGHGFQPQDEGSFAAIVNETFARRFWPGQDPIGKGMLLGSKGPRVEVIGVARDITYYSLGDEPRPYVYGTLAAGQAMFGVLQVRAESTGDILRQIEQAFAALDPRILVEQPMSFAELRRAPLFPSRALAIVTGAFGVVVLILTVVGIYGTIGFAVAQRTHEIGVRMAFGARPRDIFARVVGGGAALILVGIGLGIAASLAAMPLLRALLFGVTPGDALTYVVVVLVLGAAGIVAAWLPARRAARVDPVIALRQG
jgi:predicted permease